METADTWASTTHSYKFLLTRDIRKPYLIGIETALELSDRLLQLLIRNFQILLKRSQSFMSRDFLNHP